MTNRDICKPEAVTALYRVLDRYIDGKEHPKFHFDMKHWAYHKADSPSLAGEALLCNGDAAEYVCGSAACMAGGLVLEMEGRLSRDVKSDAEQLLLTDDAQVDCCGELWYTTRWPDQLVKGYHRARTEKSRARIAHKVLDRWLDLPYIDEE